MSMLRYRVLEMGTGSLLSTTRKGGYGGLWYMNDAIKVLALST
jgi:hypothetical protein